MIALDTNILIHARRQEMEHFAAADRELRRLAEGDVPWAIPWPCIYEFIRVMTHPRVFSPPSDPAALIADVEQLLESPSLQLLGDGPAHAGHMLRALRGGEAWGSLVHDAHIAALLYEHGVREFWTLDRDFARFPGLNAVNPFAARAK